jgi:hypothetical protein
MGSSIWGWVFFYVFCAIMGGVVLMFLWFFWQDAWPPIRNGLIKLNSEPAKATILEVKKIGSGFESGSTFGSTRDLVNATKDYQPVWVKLEVRPNNGASYIASDRFNLAVSYNWRTGPEGNIIPGAELQVAVSRFNRYWVVALPETATNNSERSGNDPKKAAAPSVPAAAPAPRSNTALIIVIAIVVVAIGCCVVGVGAFAYSRYVAAGNSLPGMSGQIATAVSSGSPATGLPSDATAAPVLQSGSSSTTPSGGLGDEITRTMAWGRALSAIFQANPMSCQAPDAANTSIEVTQQPDSSGTWQERWTVACDGASAIPVDMTFTPSSGGMFNINAKIAK